MERKKKNNDYNVVILFMRGVPAIPCDYPTRCVGHFTYTSWKKKKKKLTEHPAGGLAVCFSSVTLH